MPKLNRDGVALGYEEAGSGNPPVMLVHCWGGDRGFMRPQLEHLRRKHRTVAVDLRGFGESDKPEQAYTMAGFADDLAWMAGELRVERPVLVGHSMGGTVVLEASARHPELYSAVIILEALVVAPPALIDGFRPVLEGIKTPAYGQILAGLTAQLTGPHFDPADRARISASMVANAPHVMISALEHVIDGASESAAARCKVPLLYVAAAGPWYTDVARFSALCPQLATARLVGCGHYFELEVPEQVNPMIERFIDTLPRS